MGLLEIRNRRVAVGPTYLTPEAVEDWVEMNAHRIDLNDTEMFTEMATELAPELCGYAMVLMAAVNRE